MCLYWLCNTPVDVDDTPVVDGEYSLVENDAVVEPGIWSSQEKWGSQFV